MSRAPFIISPQALQDLDEIWLFIAHDSIAAADRFEGKLRSAIQRLAESPRIGHTRQDLTEQPVRFWAIQSYLIVYDPAKRPIEIVRVLHGARDIASVLE